MRSYNSILVPLLTFVLNFNYQLVQGWVLPATIRTTKSELVSRRPTHLNVAQMTNGENLHGESACFLPLKQLDQDYYAPRIIQIAGTYPGITKEEYEAVTSEPPAALGQWTYDFSDPDGPQMGTVAVEGSPIITDCQDPVVIIAEHTYLGVPLPEEIKDAVDLVVVVDRAEKTFGERKFLVFQYGESDELRIGAFGTYADMPEGCNILGQVQFVQIPWLPAMKSTRSGFQEEDALY